MRTRFLSVALLLACTAPLAGCGEDAPTEAEVAECVIAAASEAFEAYTLITIECEETIAAGGGASFDTVAECVLDGLGTLWEAYEDARDVCEEALGDGEAPEAAAEAAARVALGGQW